MKSWRSLLIGLSLLYLASGLGSHSSRAHAADDAAEQTSTLGGQCCGDERVDDVWLISTRHLGCPSTDNTKAVDLHVEHYGGKGIGWTESSLAEYLASDDPARPTMIYVHGNRIDRCEAIRRGAHVRNSVLGCSQVEPVRFVIWTWPSDQIHGQVRDVRAKAARTNGEGYYLASFISQLDPDTRLSIVGYSFGARVTTGALHLLGGGELAGLSLPYAQTPQVRVALMAAALHNNWLQPGARHGSALSQMDRLLIQYNSCDPYLKRYKYIEKHARPAALGYAGMHVDNSQGVWLDQRDVCPIVGRSHAQIRYFNSKIVTDQIRAAFFGE